MMSSVRAGSRVLFVTAMVLASASCSGSESKPAAAWTSPHVTSPAVSGVDDTVWLQIQLADSFDVYPDGTCAGRDDNRGMRDQAWVLLHGESTGLYDQTKASARFKHYPPVMYHGEPLSNDDYRYCVIDAVFSPSIPDPDGYSVKFAGTPREQWLGRPGRTPFGQPDRPGYGKLAVKMQTCRSLLDPPDKECPEWAD